MVLISAHDRYTFHDADSSWEEARKACRSMGAHLVTMDTMEEWNKVRKLIAEKLEKDPKHTHWYIGLRKESGTWRWKGDGSPGVSLANDDSRWQLDEPTTGYPKENCAEINGLYRGQRGHFNNVECDIRYQAEIRTDPRGYICEKCHHCYTFHDVDSSWEEARTACRSMGAHLVTMDTMEEWNKVRKLIAEKLEKDPKHTHWYIGLRKESGTWRWKGDGSPGVSLANDDSRWQLDEPTTGYPKENCAEINGLYRGQRGHFNNVECDIRYQAEITTAAGTPADPRGYICEN